MGKNDKRKDGTPEQGLLNPELRPARRKDGTAEQGQFDAWNAAEPRSAAAPTQEPASDDGLFEQEVVMGEGAHEAGSFEEAERHFLRALDRAAGFSQDDLRRPFLLRLLAGNGFAAGRFEEAERWMRLCLEACGRCGDDEACERDKALESLGRVLLKLGRSGEALEPLDRALELREKKSGPFSPGLVGLLEARAELFEALGRPEDAAAARGRAKAVFEKVGRREASGRDRVLRLRPGAAAKAAPPRSAGGAERGARAALPENSTQAVVKLLKRLPDSLHAAVREHLQAVQGAENGVHRAHLAAAAVPRIDELAAERPHEPMLVLIRGFFRRVSNDFEGAVRDLTQGLKAYTDEPQVYFWRATAYGALGRFAESVADLDRALERAPSCAEYYKLRGQSKEKLGLLDEAIADFGSALKIDPGFYWAHIGRSMCLTRQGRLQEALADLDRSIELCPVEEWAYVKRSLLRRELGDLRGAVDDVTKACEINPSCDWVLGKPPFQETELTRAVEQLSSLIRQEPGSGWAWAWRGQTRLKLNDPASAEADFTQALAQELGRGRGWVLAWRGEARRLLGRGEEAAADLDEAARERPDYPRTYYWRGLARRDLGRGEEALADLKLSAELDDRSPEVHAALGLLHQQLGHLEEAEAALSRGLRMGAGSGEMLKARSQVRAARGNVEGQIEDLAAHYGKIPVPAQGWRRSWEELVREAGEKAAQGVWSRLSLPIEVYLEQAEEALGRRDAAAALEILDCARRKAEGGGWRLHRLRGLALRLAGRPEEAVLELKSALQRGPEAEGAPAAPARPAPAAVDPRVEFLGALQFLIEPRPDAEFAPRLAPELARFAGEAEAVMSAFKAHPALALVKERLMANPSYRWFPLADLLMSVKDLKTFEPRTDFAKEHRHRPLFDGLKDLAERSQFQAFMDSRAAELARAIFSMANALGREDFTDTVGRYLGVEVRADFGFVVSALCRRVSYSNEIRRPDGWVFSRTIVSPMSGEQALRDCLLAPSRAELWVKGWHELCHVPMDPWGEAHAAAIGRREDLYARVSGIARRQNWLDCFSEHLVLSPGLRLCEERLGPEAARGALTKHHRTGYIYMESVAARLKDFEAGRSEYKSLADFYPQWLGVLDELKA